MHRLLLLLRLVLVGFAVAATAAQAQTSKQAASRASASAPQRDAASLLRMARTAAQRLNYAGTFVYQQGSQVRSSRITHVFDGRNELEKLEVLDGVPREYLRTNDEIVAYLPQSRTLRMEKRVTQDVFPAIIGATPAELAGNYEISSGTSERIAGFEADAVRLQPKDRLRYGYALWTERATGLLLRVQTLSENGDVIEQITFTQLDFGRIDRSRVKPSFADTRGWRVENVVIKGADLAGWSVRGLPPGFRKVREIRRLVSERSKSASAEGTAAGSTREVSQIVFSDGLAAISVFIEPLTPGRTEGFVRQGAMQIVGKRQGEFWLTIVGEVPSEAIRQVAASIEFKFSR
jgi:sigma-E factor negative regulatory protein RseB